MAMLRKCRIVHETINLFEVDMPGGYIPVRGINPYDYPALIQCLQKVESPVTHPSRYVDHGDPWMICYTGEVEDDFLDRILPVGWRRRIHIDHLFTLHEDFGFYLEHMMNAFPEIKAAREANQRLVDTLLDLSQVIKPIKRWNELTIEDVRKAFVHAQKGVVEIEELRMIQRVFQTFLDDKNQVSDLERKIVEDWYRNWYNDHKHLERNLSD